MMTLEMLDPRRNAYGVGAGGIQVHAELYADGFVPHDFVASAGAPLISVRFAAIYVAQNAAPSANLVTSRVGSRARRQLHHEFSRHLSDFYQKGVQNIPVRIAMCFCPTRGGQCNAKCHNGCCKLHVC